MTSIAPGIRSNISQAYVPMSMARHQNRMIGDGDKKAPSLAVWLAAATQAAQESGVSPSLVIGPSRKCQATWARWNAWKRILDANPAYSIAGLARTCGWDHTAILYALKRLSGLTAAELIECGAKASIASGRRPKR